MNNLFQHSTEILTRKRINHAERSIILKVSYKSIFGQKYSFFVNGIIDAASRENDYMVPRGTSTAVPLKCVGDPGWNAVVHIGEQ